MRSAATGRFRSPHAARRAGASRFLLPACAGMVLLAWALVLAEAAVAQPRTAQPRSAPHLSHAFAAPAGASWRAAAKAAAPFADTVRVLAVMVEFQSDEDSRTSGSGRFGTVYPYDYGGDIVDPLPWDRSYFEAHVRFLANYVAKASGGRTVLLGSVIDSVVTVSKQIKDYSYRSGESETPVADLAAEAWTLADALPGVDVSAADMFIVFHAGRGRDIDLVSIQGSDPTPLDIPSLSFTLDAFRRLYGADYAGIPARGGAFHITNCAVLPSTDSREIPLITGELYLLELSINGLLAASFGTYAGLPDLFNTASGVTGIGRFGLMDPESIFAYGGICPPAPSAWEKQALGWTYPREAQPGKREYLMTAQRFDQPSTTDVLRVPITGTEYWLLENRQRDPGGNGQRVTLRVGGQDLDMRFAKDTTGFENSTVSALKGVVVDVEDIDWALPGGTVQVDDKEQRISGGLLVWHIDETVIDAHRTDNTVNNSTARRGVDLEQASGSQDIGKQVPTVLGTQTGTGSPLDFWFRGNLSPLYANAFNAVTTPDTRANSKAFTHVAMDNISTAGPIMSLDIAVGDARITPLAGWPVDLRPWLAREQTALAVQSADADGDGAHEFFVTAGAPLTGGAVDTVRLFALARNGTPFLAGAPTPLVAEFPGLRYASGAPIIGEVQADGGTPEIVIALMDSARAAVTIVVLAPRDGNGDKRLDELQRITFPASRLPSEFDEPWLILTEWYLAYLQRADGVDSLHFVNGNGDWAASVPSGARTLASVTPRYVYVHPIGLYGIDGNATIPPESRSISANGHAANAVLSDFTGDWNSEAAALDGGFSLSSFIHPEPQTGETVSTSLATASRRPVLAVADADGDGRNDVLVADSSRIIAVNGALAVSDYYPAAVGARYALSARLVGAGAAAIFVAGEESLSQLGTRARQAEGFPVPLPRSASVILYPTPATPAALGIAAASADGRVYLFETPNALADSGLVWRSIYGNERNANATAGLPAVPPVNEDLLPAARCYNWPNPTQDNRTKIRYYVSRDAVMTVTIYDLAGDRVGALSAKAVGGMDNEIEWDASHIQSGVYLAHVKAETAAGSASKIIKIAVVR